eukprot:Lithocolla_globosa_v1_NODE_2777_length_1871_cov_14.307269.p2 type:complete len:151 gc:universal NODE_2777_length_1871_cov_14.307269:700-248(-)
MACIVENVPTQVSQLRKGGMVMLKNKPCKILEMSRSAPGKHGHSKTHIIAMDISSQKKVEDVFPSHDRVPVPELTKKEYIVTNISQDGWLNYMNDKYTLSEVRLDLESQLGKKIWAKFEDDKELLVTVQSCLGEEAVIEFKLVQENKQRI